VAAATDIRGEGAEAAPIGVDVADQGSVHVALARVRVDLGPVDILVTSAGIDPSTRTSK
jgi:NAD(P)-dependent dehydrogenase (short-subunit alcohol dehydrogenase family)